VANSSLPQKTRFELTDFVNDLRTFFGIIDLDGYLAFVNDAPVRAAGLRSEELIKTLFWEFPWFSHDSEISAIIRSCCQKSAAGQEASNEIFVRMGETFTWVEINFHPAFDAVGEVMYTVVEGIGIDRRKKIEAEIIQTNQALEQIIFERTRDLEEINQQLTMLSETDYLTKLSNRLVYERRLLENIATAQRSGKHLSLLMIDVDHFKAYNDNYGHDYGDIVLRTIAGAIRQSSPRKTDLVARFGGEEFVVLLPDTDGDSALEMGQKIRLNVKALAIKHEFSTTSRSVTVSVGVGTAQGAELNEINLAKEADGALYDAKEAGRNCCRRTVTRHPSS